MKASSIGTVEQMETSDDLSIRSNCQNVAKTDKNEVVGYLNDIFNLKKLVDSVIRDGIW